MRISTAMIFEQQAQALSSQTSALSVLSAKISSGNKRLAASDDPVGAAQSLMNEQYISRQESFSKNASVASSRLEHVSSTLDSMIGALESMKEYLIQAQSGTSTAQDQTYIAQSTRQLLGQLSSEVNSQDELGNFIFSGTAGAIPAAALTATGWTMNSQGSATNIQINESLSVQSGWLASSEFSFKTGENGVDYTLPITNMGSGFLSTVSGLADGTSGSLSFAASGAGIAVNVLDASGTVTAGPIPWKNGMSILAGGATVQVGGNPAAGDVIQFGPSASENILNLAQNISATLADTSLSSGVKTAQLSRLNQQLSTAFNRLNGTNSQVGSQLSLTAANNSQLSSRLAQLSTQQSALNDLDYAAALSEFSKLKTINEASMKTAASIEKLSLFNFI